MNEKKYLKWYQKVAYGSGDAAANCGYALISSFVLFYLTNTVGLNSVIVGTLMAISKVFDGITDIIFGTMVDRTKSKLGKARPWMLYGQIGVSASLFLVFSIPSMSETMQYAYFFVFYTAFNAIFFTANNIAYATLSALITRNKQERVQLGSLRSIFALFMSLIVAYTTMGMVESFGGGAKGWRMVALIFALVALAINTFSALMVKELPDEELEETEETVPAKKEEKIGLVKALKLILTNPYYLIIVGCYLLNYATSGIVSAAGVYFCTYFLEDQSFYGTLSMVSMVPMLLGMIVTPALVKKAGSMRAASLGGFLVICAAGILQIFVVQQKNILLFLILACVISFASSPYNGTINAMVAETADYTWRKKKVRVDGTMFSCSSIGVKVGGGIGSAVAGILLAAGGFDGTAAVQTDSAVQMIFFMYIVLPVILRGAIAVLLYFLKVEKANADWDKTHAKEGAVC